MDFTLFAIAEAALLASSLSLDALAVGFAYGTDKTKIPMLSALIISLICGVITGLSLLAGTILKPFLPRSLTLVLSFSLLFLIGLTKLADSTTKAIIRKHGNVEKSVCGSLFNFRFVLNLYANPEAADIDSSKSISAYEAMLLAASLSLDGVAVGFGAALANCNGMAVFLWSLLTNVFFLLLGHFCGGKIARTGTFNLSWLSGVVLICLAISKFF